MGTLLQRHALSILLGLVALALLVVIGIETGWGANLRAKLPVMGGKVAPVDAKLLPPVVAEAPEALYPETGNRPLFTPTRRPAPAAVAQTTMNKGQFVLQGVTIVGDLRIALLRERAGNKTHRVEKGRDVNGITVAEIESDKVTLRQGNDSEVVGLLVQRPGTLPPVGLPGAAPPAAAPPVSAGPFATPPAPVAPVPTAPPAAAVPGASPVRPPQPNMPPRTGGGPVPVPGQPALPGGPSFPTTPAPAPGAAATPTGEMTAEEILARRRARRIQQQQ